MGKKQGRLGSSGRVRDPVYAKENSETKLLKLCLKIDSVSHPARLDGLGKYINVTK